MTLLTQLLGIIDDRQNTFTHEFPIQIKRRASEMRIVIPGPNAENNNVNPTLIQMIAEPANGS